MVWILQSTDKLHLDGQEGQCFYVTEVYSFVIL